MSSPRYVSPRSLFLALATLVVMGLLLVSRFSTPVSEAAPAADPAIPTFTPYYFGGVNETNSVALGDINGDGALDIVQGNNAQGSWFACTVSFSACSRIYLNNGHGEFGVGPTFG